MSRALITPYRTPSPDTVNANAWHVEGRRVESSLVDWTPGTPVVLQRQIMVDVPEVLKACGLPDTAKVALVAVAVCAATTLRVASKPMILGIQHQPSYKSMVELELPGHELASSIKVHTYLVSYGRNPSSPIVPWRSGFVLWEDDIGIRLEGKGARFPMEVRDFKKQDRINWPARAMWKLDWDPDDLDEPMMGSLRLFLNTSHPAIKKMLEESDKESGQYIMKMVHYEVGRLMVTTALRSGEFIENIEEYEDNTVGHMLRLLIKSMARAGDSVENMSQRLRNNPVQFEAEIQSRLHVMEDK